MTQQILFQICIGIALLYTVINIRNAKRKIKNHESSNEGKINSISFFEDEYLMHEIVPLKKENKAESKRAIETLNISAEEFKILLESNGLTKYEHYYYNGRELIESPKTEAYGKLGIGIYYEKGNSIVTRVWISSFYLKNILETGIIETLHKIGETFELTLLNHYENTTVNLKDLNELKQFYLQNERQQ